MNTLPDAKELADFLPLAQRVLAIDAASVIRLRAAEDTVSAYVRLPYDVVAGRTITVEQVEPVDVTVHAAAFVDWLEGRDAAPPRRDALWLQPLPPRTGWRRLETVPDAEIREVVRSGASLAQTTTTRAGQESLLGSTVLRVSGEGETVEVPLGPLSALTKMGFLPRDSRAAVDIAPGWLRVAAPYGSTFVATARTSTLGMLTLL